MKSKLLMTSASLTGAATLLGIGSILGASAKAGSIAGLLVLGAIGIFVIALASRE